MSQFNEWIAHALGSSFLVVIGVVTATIFATSLFWLVRSYAESRRAHGH